MLIFSRKLFLKKFREHFHEASDKSCAKINRNTEVPISFLEFKPCKTNNIIPFGGNTKIPFLKLLKYNFTNNNMFYLCI